MTQEITALNVSEIFDKKKQLGKFERILITSALPYVNNYPHLGNLIGAILSADVYFKHTLLNELESIYICGTDEHGTTSEMKAREEKVTPKELCDRYHELHKKAYEWFNISFSHFGRTSKKENFNITKDIFLKLKENGYIITEEVEQAYCEHDDMDLADRFVIGTCPNCSYENADGSQCENCGKLLDPFELINPKCKLCGKTPTKVKRTHLFIDLPKLKYEIVDFIKSKTTWSENAVKFSLNWIEQGLTKRAITRHLNWGIPVPGYEDLVFYVWFDAPIGYISITKEYFNNNEVEFNKWWKNNQKTKLVQFMGKDNIPFHTIIFPAQLIGTKENWTMLDTLSSTEYLNYEGGMFSKSKNRGIFSDSAMNSGIPSDYYRFYLILNRPEKSDTNFLWDDFYERINNDLIGNLINFCYRTIHLTHTYFGEIPNHKIDDKLFSEVSFILEEYSNDFSRLELKKSIKEVLKISQLGNKYIQENEPWKLIKTDIEKTKNVLGNAIELVKILAIITKSFIPDISTKISDTLLLDKKGITSYFDLNKVIIGELNQPQKLGEKLKLEHIEELKKQYKTKDDLEETKKSQKNKNKNKHNIQEENKKIKKIDNIKKNKMDFYNLNIRVGKIIEITEHENADKLFVETVDFGDEKRQIVSGLRKYFQKEDLLDKKFIFLTNIPKIKLRGKDSEGMILACSNDKLDEVKLISADESKTGERIILKKDADNEIPKSETKITIDDFFDLKFKIKDKKIHFKDSFLVTKSNEELIVNMSDEVNSYLG